MKRSYPIRHSRLFIRIILDFVGFYKSTLAELYSLGRWNWRLGWGDIPPFRLCSLLTHKHNFIKGESQESRLGMHSISYLSTHLTAFNNVSLPQNPLSLGLSSYQPAVTLSSSRICLGTVRPARRRRRAVCKLGSIRCLLLGLFPQTPDILGTAES